jgi:hypothetical protein
MSLELIRSRVSRQQDGDWDFGYRQSGNAKEEPEGSFDLSAEIVEKVWEQTVGPVPHNGLQTHDVVREWDRLQQRLREEVENGLRA